MQIYKEIVTIYLIDFITEMWTMYREESIQSGEERIGGRYKGAFKRFMENAVVEKLHTDFKYIFHQNKLIHNSTKLLQVPLYYGL